jgi:putative N6-adenine-specific DNA methylase
LSKLQPGDFDLTITTLYGLEQVLADEVLSIGGRNVKQLNRAVSCTGDLGFIYKCNFLLRTAIKVLRPLATVRFRDDLSYYKAIKKINWPDFFDINKTFTIQVSGKSMMFRNSLYAAQKAKDALADCFRDATNGNRPSVGKFDAHIHIAIHLKNHEAEIYLNSSGDSLHRRGYREEMGPATINEVLAAGILKFTGWTGGKPFFDPMCGSGTFLIEAAMLASKIPAGVFRTDFSFTHWHDYDEELFNTIRDGALKRAIEYPGKLIGRDHSAGALEAARANITKSLLDDLITLRKGDFTGEEAPAGPGILVMNPPYNKKIKSDNEKLYAEIGRTLKHQYSGWEVYIISADLDAVKHIGLKPAWKRKLYNGQLESLLLKYEMFTGSRKEHKTN